MYLLRWNKAALLNRKTVRSVSSPCTTPERRQSTNLNGHVWHNQANICHIKQGHHIILNLSSARFSVRTDITHENRKPWRFFIKPINSLSYHLEQFLDGIRQKKQIHAAVLQKIHISYNVKPCQDYNSYSMGSYSKIYIPSWTTWSRKLKHHNPLKHWEF